MGDVRKREGPRPLPSPPRKSTTVAPDPDRIVVLDFGSQYTQLIARRVREEKVFSEIVRHDLPIEKIAAKNPKGIILSGGPSSVYDSGAPICDPRLFDLGIPVLGICYGMQLMTHLLGGKVARSARREYGRTELMTNRPDGLLAGVAERSTVWMSHGDRIEQAAPGFSPIARSDHSPLAGIADPARHLYALQFHPEVVHTACGREILRNFIFGICSAKADWEIESFIERASAEIRERVGGAQILCALSGGVDSAVTATLVHRAVGDQLTCVFVNNGLLRAGEAEWAVETFRKHLKINLRYVDATDSFLKKLRGVIDPEKKRRIIGREFIRIFEGYAREARGARFLAQGTLYPDVIESASVRGPSATIKTHHNVGGLPKRMRLRLVEPLRDLFKDEVRLLGKRLGLQDEILLRHPFPGPGLAVRIVGEVTRERLATVRAADAIVEEEIRSGGYYDKVWQAFAVFLPVRSVGVMGDGRTYDNVIAVRAVESIDGMTADWARLPYDLLSRIANRVVNEVPGINRAVYDISSKPPATIEWE